MAVGVVFNQEGQVLVGQRVVKDRYFAKWEFPGGKLEAGETVEQALIREFREETDINIRSSAPLIIIEHDYPDRQVRLHVHKVDEFNGEVRSVEGQALKWVSLDELEQLDFLQGNRPILEKLREKTVYS